MVNAQKWLEGKYSGHGRTVHEARAAWSGRTIQKKIHLTEPSLEGELDLSNFTNKYDVKVYISPSVDETKLTFKNLSKEVRIITRYVCGYTDLNNLTKEGKTKLEVLKISQENLEGELDLSDFINLKKLNCDYNNLTSLNVSNCSQLTELRCSNNLLTNLTLPTNPTNLKKLNLESNNFNQDLFFLSGAINLKYLNLSSNNFTGSLDYLSGMEQLEELDISDTYINEVDIDKLPRSLKKIRYSTNKGCKLTTIVPLLEPVKWGWCDECKEPNTSEKWCQSCAEKEWKQLEGQELIEKFVEQQRNKLKWIPYEEFTNIQYLAEGGFSQIYKAKWGKEERQDVFRRGKKMVDRIIVLKSLTNSNPFVGEKELRLCSQNIIDFLTEIANTKLVDYGSSIPNNPVVSCYGISQDPQTKNYVMVMKYMDRGNLRQYLQNKTGELSFWDKLEKLRNIANGLYAIHHQNLVHQDFHSGNILHDCNNGRLRGSDVISYITDLGLSRPVNHPKQTGQIFGVLPYITPEILRGQPYTKASDIYSFGIIAYELFANSYPYPKMDDNDLILGVCFGKLRPNIDKVPIPQLLKDIIKKCWETNPEKRPSAEELMETLGDWCVEIRDKEDTEFYQQYQEIELEYHTFSQKPYQIHPTTTTTSKMIDTKQISELISSRMLSIDLSKVIPTYNKNYRSIELDFDIEMETKKEKNTYQTQEWNFDIETPTSTQEITKRLRSMSMEEANQKETKSTKLGKIEKQEFHEEPIEIEENNWILDYWQRIHCNFTLELVKEWTNYRFTAEQCRGWMSINSLSQQEREVYKPTYYAWLRDIKHLTPEQVLNHGNLEQLNQEWKEQQQSQLQTHQEIPPKQN